MKDFLAQDWQRRSKAPFPVSGSRHINMEQIWRKWKEKSIEQFNNDTKGSWLGRSDTCSKGFNLLLFDFFFLQCDSAVSGKPHPFHCDWQVHSPLTDTIRHLVHASLNITDMHKGHTFITVTDRHWSHTSFIRNDAYDGHTSYAVSDCQQGNTLLL